MSAQYTAEPMTLGEVTLLGVEVAPTSVVINGQVHTDNYDYNNKVKLGLTLDFKKEHSRKIWTLDYGGTL